MKIRGSALAGGIVGGLGVMALALSIHSAIASHGARDRIAGTKALVEGLGLTDLALFTEARYTRHLSLADQQSPFQDAPMSIEHFPAGSLTPPHIPPAGRLSATETEAQ